MSRTTLSQFKKKALTKSSVKKEYEALSPAYKLRKKLILNVFRLRDLAQPMRLRHAFSF
jgi:hypothetical protein